MLKNDGLPVNFMIFDTLAVLAVCRMWKENLVRIGTSWW